MKVQGLLLFGLMRKAEGAHKVSYVSSWLENEWIHSFQYPLYRTNVLQTNEL